MHKLSINRDKTDCPWQNSFKDVYLDSELAPDNLCLLAFHSIYPYYLTLTNGGWFSWVRPRDGVVVQCPDPENAVEMKIFLCDSGDEVRVEVLRNRGECRKGHKKEDMFHIGPRTFEFCPKALGAFIPYLEVLANKGELVWKDDSGRMILRCPHTACGNAEFVVEEA